MTRRDVDDHALLFAVCNVFKDLGKAIMVRSNLVTGVDVLDERQKLFFTLRFGQILVIKRQQLHRTTLLLVRHGRQGGFEPCQHLWSDVQRV